MDTIRLAGLTAVGRHGLLPEERERPQPFRVDAELHLDLTAAGASDDIADTVDYGSLTSALAQVVRSESFLLLERLASRLADVCLVDARVDSVSVEVTKLRPPVPEPLEAASVRVTRQRSGR